MSHYIKAKVAMTSLEKLEQVLTEMGLPFEKDVQIRGYATHPRVAIGIRERHATEHPDYGNGSKRLFGDIGFDLGEDGFVRAFIDDYDTQKLQPLMDKITERYLQIDMRAELKRRGYNIVEKVNENGETVWVAESTIRTRVTPRAQSKRFRDTRVGQLFGRLG